MYCFSSTLLALHVAVTNKLKYFFSKWIRSQVYIVAVCVNLNSINIDVTSGQSAILGCMFKCGNSVAIFIANTFSVVNVIKITIIVQTTTFALADSNGLRYPKLLRSEQYPLEMN